MESLGFSAEKKRGGGRGEEILFLRPRGPTAGKVSRAKEVRSKAFPLAPDSEDSFQLRHDCIFRHGFGFTSTTT